MKYLAWDGLKEYEIESDEPLAPLSTLAVDEKLNLGQFRAEGIDDELKEPEKHKRELIAALRYLGNSAWPRLAAGKQWGEWTKEDVTKYFAKIVDVLRSEVGYEIEPPPVGDEKWKTGYWQCYTAAQKYMKSSGQKAQARFVLTRRDFRGPIVIRFGSSTKVWDLYVRDGESWHLQLQSDPLKGETAGTVVKGEDKVVDTSGKSQSVFDLKREQSVDLKPGSALNPTKETPASLEVIDTGTAQALSIDKATRKYNFDGEALKGGYFFRAEDEKDPSGFWLMSRSGGPETKEQDMKEITVLIDDDQLDEAGDSSETETEDEKARGEGQGVGGPRQGDGGAVMCVCPKCGREFVHTKGEPCNKEKCPDCGVALVGKEEETTTGAEGKTALESLRRAIIGAVDSALGKLIKGEKVQTEESQEDEKGGRRLRSSKVEELEKVADDLDKVLKALKIILGWTKGEDENKLSPFEQWLSAQTAKSLSETVAEKGAVAGAVKAKDGRTWWMQWTTNAFRDREKEIFTTKAIKEFVERHRDDEVKGKFWYRHIPGTKFGDIRWQAEVGRMLVQMGPFDDTPVGQAFKSFFTKYPNGHPDIAANGWGTSHKYQYREEDRKDGVYEWFEIIESTVLPLQVAANPWNPAPKILQEAKEMNDQEVKELETIAGETGVANLVELVKQLGEQTTKELEENVAFKAGGSYAKELRAIAKGEDESVCKQLEKLADQLDDQYPKPKKAAGDDEEEEEEEEKYPKPKKKSEAEGEPEAEDEKAGKFAKIVSQIRLLAGRASDKGSKKLKALADKMAKFVEEGYPKPKAKALDREEVAEALVEVVKAVDARMDEFAENIKAIKDSQEALQGILEALTKDDAEKVAEKAAQTPPASLASLLADRLGEPQRARVRSNSKFAQMGPEEAPPGVAGGGTGIRFVDDYVSGADQRQQ